MHGLEVDDSSEIRKECSPELIEDVEFHDVLNQAFL